MSTHEPVPQPLAARVFVAFGANLGDPASAYIQAITALGALPDTRVLDHSRLYRSRPVGVRNQPDYLNAVIELSTGMAPTALLQAMLAIERRAGRTREADCTPRTMDLDLLLYEQKIIREPGLEVPHPRMHQRAFVLAPLTELAPEIEIPGHGSAQALLEHVQDQEVIRL